MINEIFLFLLFSNYVLCLVYFINIALFSVLFSLNLFCKLFSYHNLLKRGARIAIRAKVNDSLMTGLRVVDCIIPVGRGQRQLILGDRYTGKTSIFISLLLYCSSISELVSIDGFGTNRIFGVYIGINQNLSKLLKSCSFLSYYSSYLFLCLATHSASSSLLSFMIPLIGISIGERVRDRGNDICLCFDDLSKHSKSYRQLSLILAKIPSREAFPSDIFNIHSSLLERCGKLSAYYFGGSISSFPFIETINSDITEYIATNVISITDGQFYTNKRLFLDCCRPAIDSGLSVSRIGSNAQCKLMKTLSVGIKNELTYFRYRIMELSNVDFSISFSLNNIFCQDQMFISAIESSMILVLLYRCFKNNSLSLFLLFLLLAIDYLYLYYIIAITKNLYSYSIYSFIIYWFYSFLSLSSAFNINSLHSTRYIKIPAMLYAIYSVSITNQYFTISLAITM
jgi:hypothetical protein